MPRSKVGRVRTRSVSWGARSRGGRVEGLATRGNAARGGRNDVRRAQVAIGSPTAHVTLPGSNEEER